MKEECNLSINVVTRQPAAKNSSKTPEARTTFVKEWVQKGMVYMQNCVFLDASGLDINMRRSRSWSQRGTQATIESPSARAIAHTIIDAISAYGAVNVNIRKFQKKRKVFGATKRKSPETAASIIPKGTTAGHYVQFISDTLDIMDEFSYIKGFVMDNAPIHNYDLVDLVVIERGFIHTYIFSRAQ